LVPQREQPNHPTPTGLLPGHGAPDCPQAVRIRHLNCTTAALEFSDGFMRPMPRVDQTGTPLRVTPRCDEHTLAVQWLRRFDPLKYHALAGYPSRRKALHGRSIRNEARMRLVRATGEHQPPASAVLCRVVAVHPCVATKHHPSPLGLVCCPRSDPRTSDLPVSLGVGRFSLNGSGCEPAIVTYPAIHRVGSTRPTKVEPFPSFDLAPAPRTTGLSSDRVR
jgi:hypothetical protein